MPEKFMINLDEASKSIQLADHMIYITYHLLKEKKILLNALEKIYEAVIQIINAILQYDYMWKRIQLYSNPKDNFDTFVQKCAPRYSISQSDIVQITELFKIVEMHKKSPMEFVRREKVVIMSSNSTIAYTDVEKIKGYIRLARNMLQKAKLYIKSI